MFCLYVISTCNISSGSKITLDYGRKYFVNQNNDEVRYYIEVRIKIIYSIDRT